jgi:cellulose synthase/poly-beta-1,6-N-acetylglucosamine synthase-like glycosyltransferase
MFLMLSIKKRKGKIRFLKSTEAIVQTPVCLSVSEFFNQRKRWASKSKSYTDWQVIGLALLVFSLSLGFIVLLIGGFADILFLKAAIFIYIFKTFVDLSLLYPALKFYSQEKLIFYVPVLQIFYPFYVVVTAIGALFGKFKWK